MRRCDRCDAEISACMGFVNAGDFTKFVEGKLPKNEIRELCGKCVFIKEKELDAIHVQTATDQA